VQRFHAPLAAVWLREISSDGPRRRNSRSGDARVDEHIKNLPKGQMEILMTDNTRGTLHQLLHVRPPQDVTIPMARSAERLHLRSLVKRAQQLGVCRIYADCDRPQQKPTRRKLFGA
jgi:hypothetical protein